MAPQTPEVVGQILAIPVAHIVIGKRLRPIDPVWAAALGQIMAADEQNTPIEVCQLPGHNDYLLVAGGHRLVGAQLQGWKTIKAIVVDSSAIERRLREVAENLWRKGLGPMDRAAFIGEFIELLKVQAGVDPAKDGRTASAQARWQKELKNQAADASVMMTLAYGWADEAAEQVGLSRKTIYRDLEVHTRLLPEVSAQIRGLPIASNAGQLRALAKLPEADQRAVAALLVEGRAKGATEALGILRQKPKPDAEKKAWSAFIGGWSRMNGRRRREALRELKELGLPSGVRIVFEDEER